MEVPETELTSSEPDALGADFITVELDTQPIEYVVKWAEVGSKFTISCVKKDSDEDACFTAGQLVKTDQDETFYAPYEAVYEECEDVDPSLGIAQDEEVRSDSDVDDNNEPGSSHLGGEDDDGSDEDWDKGGSHSKQQPYSCHLCGKSYSHSSSLARHLHMHSGDRSTLSSPPKEDKLGENKKSLQCNQCGVRCNGKRLLAIHKKCHQLKRLHTCNTCGKHFNHSSSLSRHRLIHKKAKGLYPAPAPAPEATQRRRQSNQGGRKKKLPAADRAWEKQYQCTQCDKVFRNSTSLSKHQVSHVRQLLNSYTQGKDALAKSSDLKIRLKLCSRDKPNYYTLCKKNKRSKGGKRTSPQQADERSYACLLCDKRFSHTSSLARHEQTHAGEKQYPCSVCKKTFVRLSNLKQHQQTHASGKLYECQHCGKTFVHSSSFSRHKKVHSGIKQVPKQRQRNRVVDETAPLESDSE
ncbi:zinc finger protein 135 [Chanos chanos]|uniref:Zinc finger protein 135-like n=1 Tax=Chanos chanos TaxID=29144 RepID=A0A6J2V8H4_CHACN|nr:zinc finger protein 135-like [Chanos chanos]XP_030627496.1 zinc finger protein 135-like [Chanos chanos]